METKPDGFELENLDGLWPDDLHCLCVAYDSKRNRTVYGDCVYAKLSRYCWLKAGAMQDRADGRIAEALEQEKWCERIYNSLPSWAKW